LSSIREVVVGRFEELLAQSDGVPAAQVSDDLVLLRSGVDSLGFATLVVQLEDELGYDPFLLMEEAVYPTTLGQFVEMYERFASHRTDDGHD